MVNFRWTLALALALVSATAWSQAPAGEATRLLRQPDIWHDRVAFIYAGDVWTAPSSGGQARRLTAHPGDELHRCGEAK
jgi:tricorn protease